MLQPDWSILQNGASIRGVAMEGIIGEEVTLTEAKVWALGNAFVQWIGNQKVSNPITIAIGTDSRLTGGVFMKNLENGITQAGANVLNCGLVSTPAAMLATRMPEVNTEGAIMITASHQPFNRNGLKFFFVGDDVTAEQMTQILSIAQTLVKRADQPGESHIYNLIALYCHKLRTKICAALSDMPNPEKPLEGLHIVVDAGNGAGGFYASRILETLGADIAGSQFLEPDGRFMNHVPNPEDYEAMQAVSQAVLMNKADLGIVFDTDVDRVAIVDSTGKGILRNELVAITAAIVLEEHPGTTIVTDSITSTGLGYFITNVLGGKHHRYQRGYRNVIDEAKRLNENGEPCWLAIETSGHAAFKDNNFYDDGAHLATRLVIKLAQLKREGKSLLSLIEGLPVSAESKEYRVQCNGGDFQRAATDTLRGLRQYVSLIPGWEEVKQNHEGLRVMCNNEDEQGWFILRLSLHDPVMPLNVESDIAGGTKVIVGKLKKYFRTVKNVNSNELYA